jgi:DNA repair exonuclease SbcCD nuclease subunit
VPTRLLAIGDIHLGRASGRLPGSLDPARLGPAAALRQAVQTALSLEVSAVLLAGDVADDTRDLYHALGVLTDVCQPLVERGIPVLAVAGNHDHDVLPRLAALLPNVHLLGAGGLWETREVSGPGGPVRVLGWSFPGAHHTTSPAQTLPSLAPDLPTIGLLHADLDATTSRYAPVSRRELSAAGEVRWLLGHLHQPTLSADHDDPGYLGSLVGLDPTETGPHGPWLLTVEGKRLTLEHLPRAPLRWERLDVAVDDLADPALELSTRVAAALQDFVAVGTVDLSHASVLGVRVRLVGRTADFAALEAACQRLADKELALRQGEQLVFLDAVTSVVAPLHDLAALAEQDDPPGLLARDLLALQAGEGEDLLHEARDAVQAVDHQANFQPLADLTLGPEDLRERLLHEGYQVLDALLTAREAPHGSA